MEKFKEFAQKYYLKEILIVFVFSLFMYLLYYGKTESFLVDVGREAYLPLRMLEGKLLYKDLFNVYGPLSYQINAVAYFIMGTNLNTLYLMGFFNSFIILFSVFFITNLFTSRKIALCTTFLVIFSCVYIKTFFNFIFPYSYAAVYALSGFLLSAVFGMLFIRDRKDGKPLFLFLAFLFAGFSFANKIEYAPYFLFLFAWLLFLKPGWKNILVAIGSFFIIPVLSFGVLLIQGVSFKDFFEAFQLIQNIVKTPALEFFYKNYGLYFNTYYFKCAAIIMIKLISVLALFCIIFYSLNFINKKYIEKSALKKLTNLSIFAVLLITALKMFKIYLKEEFLFFIWVGIFCCLVLTGFGIYYFVKFIKNNFKIPEIANQDLMYMFFLISSILVSIKGIFSIDTQCYGTFSLTVLFISLTIFGAYYIPRIFRFTDQDIWNKTITNAFSVVILLLFLGAFQKLIVNPLYTVETDRGRVFVHKGIADMESFIKYIQNNTEKNARIISLPEGAIVNFLTGHPSHDKYYYLIPVNVQLFGEETILEDFKKDPPEYFLLNDLPYVCFDTGGLCSYAPQVCNFIYKNYTMTARTSDPVNFYLYKRNK